MGKVVIFSILLAGSLAWSGCAGAGGPLSLATVATMSPAAEVVDPVTASREARQYVSAHAGAQIALGSGDSMMPFYRDNTVIVIQKVPMSELKRGMTVVYKDKEGRSLAHALVEKGDNGWVAMGLNNPCYDSQTVEDSNYVGVVVRAYQMSVNPMLALSRGLSDDSDTSGDVTAVAMVVPPSTAATMIPLHPAFD